MDIHVEWHAPVPLRRGRSQLDKVRLMKHIEGATAGRRFFLPGTVQQRRGQSLASCLALVERSLIHHFLMQGHDLANVQGTRIRTHRLRFTRRPSWFMPRELRVSRR